MRSKPPHAARQRGFTLIEILVALAVLATAVASVVAAVSSHVNNAAYLSDRTFAHWVAMNKIAELQLSTEWPAPGALNGESLMANHEWSWQVRVSTTDDSDVRRMDVEVFADRQSKSALAAIVAYVGKPQPPAVTDAAAP